MAGDGAGDTYLLIDVGHVLSHAAYVAEVEGTARLVALAEANTTSVSGYGKLLDGVRRATANLETLAGRRLLAPTGEVRRTSDGDGHGVDGVVLTTSLAPALRVALVGLTWDLSLGSALRAATVPYVTVVRTVCLESSQQRWETADLQALVEEPPEVVVLVGGVDGGPVAPIREMGEILSAAYALMPESRRPAVVFAGNERAHRPLIAAFAGVGQLHLVGNVRPDAQTENLGDLRAALAHLFRHQALSQPEELAALSQWAGEGLLYDLDAMARALRFLARRYGLARGVLGIDAGGNGSRVVLVRSEGAALTWASPYGTGAGLAELREVRDPTDVVRWMHHPLSWADVWDRLSNAEVRPGGVPQADEDWDLQQATVREVLHRTWADARQAWARSPGDGSAAAPEFDVLVARGTTLNHAKTPGRAGLMLIDALQPAGLVRLTLDWANLLPGLAGLARLNPQAAVQVLDNDGLMELGTLIAPRGLLKRGADALNVRMMVQGELRAELTVPAGVIRRLPLGVNERARLEIHPARGMDLGLGWPGRGGVAEVRGGALGVIIDTRGRPLAIPAEEMERCETMEAWQREIDDE